MLATAVAVGANDDSGQGRQAAMVAAMINQMAQLRFSRDDESEADQLGLKYMAQAGYDPTAMLDLMRVLQEASKGGPTSRKSWPPTLCPRQGSRPLSDISKKDIP